MPRRTQSTAVCLCRSMPTRKQSTARGVSLSLAQCPDARNQQPEGCLSRSLAINQPLPRSWLGEGRYERQTIARAVWSGQPLPVASARGSGSLFPAKKKKKFSKIFEEIFEEIAGAWLGRFWRFRDHLDTRSSASDAASRLAVALAAHSPLSPHSLSLSRSRAPSRRR